MQAESRLRVKGESPSPRSLRTVDVKLIGYLLFQEVDGARGAKSKPKRERKEVTMKPSTKTLFAFGCAYAITATTLFAQTNASPIFTFDEIGNRQFRRQPDTRHTNARSIGGGNACTRVGLPTAISGHTRRRGAYRAGAIRQMTSIPMSSDFGTRQAPIKARSSSIRIFRRMIRPTHRQMWDSPVSSLILLLYPK